MRILIVQLSRMGDLAQTLPLVHALREAHPGSEIVLACRAGIDALLRDMPPPEGFRLLPLSREILGALGRPRGEHDAREPNFLASEPGLSGRFELAVNVTMDLESAALTSMVAADERRGRVPAPEGELRTRGAASRYLWAMVRHRTENLFHLSDLHMLMAGLKPRPCLHPMSLRDSALRRAGERLRAAGWDGARRRIGLQIGASDFHRAWDPESFAAMAERIGKAFPADFILFGDARERERVDRFRAATPEAVIDLAGKTGLDELPALLRHCDLVIGNDTGTLHVAAAAGTPVLGIFFATAFFTETAPYGKGHAVLQAELPCSPCSVSSRCTEQKCRREMVPEAVADSALWLLGVAPRPPSLPEALRLYRSDFDDNGALLYEPADPSRASPAYRKALSSRRAWSAPLGVPAGRRVLELLAAFGAEASDAHGAAASWADEGFQSAREMAALAADAGGGSSMRLAALRSRLEEIPACLIESAPGILGDYCRMALMDLDAAGSPRMLYHLADRFGEIRGISLALDRRTE